MTKLSNDVREKEEEIRRCVDGEECINSNKKTKLKNSKPTKLRVIIF